MDTVRTIRALAVSLAACAGCTPYRFELAPERQADVNAEYRTETFTVTPPAGRWVVDTIPSDVALRGWPPRMELRPFPQVCQPGFSGFAGTVTCFVEALAARPLGGFVFCEAPSSRLGIDERPDSLGTCILLRSYELAPQYQGAEGNRAALDALGTAVSAVVESYYQERLTIWESLTMHSSGPRRGALRADLVGKLLFHRLVTVLQADTTKLVRGQVDEQLLVHFLPDRVLAVAVSPRAEWLVSGTPEWPVVRSLLLESRSPGNPGGSPRATVRHQAPRGPASP